MGREPRPALVKKRNKQPDQVSKKRNPVSNSKGREPRRTCREKETRNLAQHCFRGRQEENLAQLENGVWNLGNHLSRKRNKDPGPLCLQDVGKRTRFCEITGKEPRPALVQKKITCPRTVLEEGRKRTLLNQRMEQGTQAGTCKEKDSVVQHCFRGKWKENPAQLENGVGTQASTCREKQARKPRQALFQKKLEREPSSIR